MKQAITAALLFLALFFSPQLQAQQKWPGTFLWRISGKGLEKPSYLYGTIHLQDKRLFQFTDSLYACLEQAQGFALELDVREMMDSLFAKGIRNAEDKLLGEEEVSIDKKKIDKSTDSLLKVFGLKADKLTKKDLKNIRNYRVNKVLQQGEMPTIVDGYLYGLAQRHGKIITGIEDMVDQMSIPDELGGELSPDQVFQPDHDFRSSLEKMIRLYINKDLQQIMEFMDGYKDQEYMDIMMTRRNVKMAQRMDSLMKHRNMFFAVGVAHLPGDSGVITLLRSKGFTVEPVFSQATVTAESYASKLAKLPWQKVTNNEAYSIEMPGVPSDFNMLGEAMSMKAFFDLPTMTVYFSGYTIGGLNNFSDVERAFTSLGQNMGSFNRKIKPKNISSNDITGGEATIEIPEGTYRIRLLQKKNIMYMLMVGAGKKANLTSSDAVRFFNSFEAKELVLTEKQWKKFELADKGFTVMLPGQAKRNSSIDRNAEGSNWIFNTYDYLDKEKGLYYLVQVRDLREGYFLEGDTTYFSAYKTDMASTFDEITNIDTASFMGWPAFKMEGIVKSENSLYKIFNIIRGNRIYAFLIGGVSTADFSDVEKVFSSVEIHEYVTQPYKMQAAEGFSTSAPGTITKMTIDSTDAITEDREHFVSIDAGDAISFEIFKDLFPENYWSVSDSVFLEKKLNAYKGYNDSVLTSRFTYNGKLKAKEIVIQKTDNNTLKKVRYFVNGDTLYTIIAFIPKQSINNPQYSRFFDDFRVSHEKQPLVYNNKAQQLLASLKTSDTALLEKRMSVFDDVDFEKKDLPFLHEALVQDYIRPDEFYTSVNDKISYVIEKIYDSSTIEFVRKQYPDLPGDKEPMKYQLLNLLASIPTSSSYSLLKELIVKDLPSKGENGLRYELHDSLGLTRTLFPDVLARASDRLLMESLLPVMITLIDSGMLKTSEILSYRETLLRETRKRKDLVNKNELEWYYMISWVELAGIFNDKGSNELLHEFLAMPITGIKYNAALALLKNKQDIPAQEFNKIAASNEFRLALYEELKTRGNLHLMPAAYSTQARIAESEIHGIANDEYEATVSFAGERTIEFMGSKQKYYLFKVVYRNEEDAESETYLGITGGYPVTGKDIQTESQAGGIYWAENFDKKKIDQHLRSYLQSIESYLIKEKENSTK